MLYTVKVEKKLIVEAESADEAEELAENGDVIAENEEIVSVRATTRSERIWFDLTRYAIGEANNEN